MASASPPSATSAIGFRQTVIAHAVWLYFRFPLSLRLVEEMLMERGIVFSEEDDRAYLDLLVASAQKSGSRLIAWCLMPNHMHLLEKYLELQACHSLSRRRRI